MLSSIQERQRQVILHLWTQDITNANEIQKLTNILTGVCYVEILQKHKPEIQRMLGTTGDFNKIMTQAHQQCCTKLS